MADRAVRWDDPDVGADVSTRLFLESVRLASRLASAAGCVREATLLLRNGDVLTCVAASGGVDTLDRGPYRLSEQPVFAQAIATGEIVAGTSQLVLPVHGVSGLLGLLVIDGANGIDQGVRDTLEAVAGIAGLGVSQAEIANELQLEAERSRRLERLKSEFLNIAAHELRSPLGIIRGYSSMLSEGMLPELDRGVALAKIAEKAEEMARLISDMLETARLETLGLELDLEPIDLVEVIDDAVQAMRPMLGADHELAVFATRGDVAVVADRRRLTTVITNLIDNAIKYSPGGGEIEVGCEHDDRTVSILVRDHGIGINAEQAHLLFTRFGRLVTPETSHIRGTGLGLYLARESARLHGGDITVAPTSGGGSTFTVILPRA